MQRNSDQLSPEEFYEPVFYCRSCHSLCVMVDETMASEGWNGTYCGKCGSTDIDEIPFGQWLQEEERRKAKRREIEWSK